MFFFFFFNDPATTEIYTSIDTLSLHDALPISPNPELLQSWPAHSTLAACGSTFSRSEEQTSELQSPIDISYAVFCLKKKKKKKSKSIYITNEKKKKRNKENKNK